ncbi:MAG: radical SAM protein [Spirochaetales bacterium]|nr:radical SAM protein [Spirochaetales bacterium]
MESLYNPCQLCPRECGVNRLEGERGYCGETAQLRLATAGLHFGEEPPLARQGGSGTLFITGCAMGCPFCQNHQISRGGRGRVVEEEELVRIAQELAKAGAQNLNLVTPSHAAPALGTFLVPMKAATSLPVAWNSSGYESLEALESVAPSVNIWLPDLKTLNDETAQRCYGAPDYPEAARRAVEWMVNQGEPLVNDQGSMIQGTMIRHLVLPGELASTRGVLEWFAQNLEGRAWLSLMTQYTPVCIPGEGRVIPQRQVNEEEYAQILEWLDELGIDDGYVQDLVPGDEWLPDFNRTDPFGSELSQIIWRWEEGFITPSGRTGSI